MTDKVQKIREELVRLKSSLIHGACASQIAMETRCKEEAYDEVISLLDSLQEEPVSAELEMAAEKDVCEVMNCCSATAIPNDHIPSWVQDAMINEFIHGAKWQEKQDQSTIELAEDHAMFAGMEKMEQQMMAKAIDAHCFGFQGDALFSFKLPAGNYLVGSEVKVVVIKED